MELDSQPYNSIKSLATNNMVMDNVNTSSHMDHSMGGMGHMGGMKMYFHFGYNENYVLFSFWAIHSLPELIGSCIGIFWLAFLYEGLKIFRAYLLKRAKKCPCKATGCLRVHPNIPLEGGEPPFCHCDTVYRPSWAFRLREACGWLHGTQTILHMVQITLSYCLMLIFMTFNIWLCIAVVLGAGSGYLVFGWVDKSLDMDTNEHCH